MVIVLSYDHMTLQFPKGIPIDSDIINNHIQVILTARDAKYHDLFTRDVFPPIRFHSQFTPAI